MSAEADLRGRLARAGYRPSRRLGQNLLCDPNLATAIVRDAGVRAGEVVLEVGPGAGALTRPLLAAGARVLAIEIDSRLADELETALAGEAGLEVSRTDVLASKHRLADAVLERLPGDGDWSCVSNLPYSVSGPVLALLARLEHPPRHVTVLVQKEVAERLAASPGTKAWGPLGLRIQSVFDVRAGREVSRDVFWPRPAVASQLVHMRREPGALDRGRLERLDTLIERVFGRRRQTLARVLKDALGDRAAAEALLEQCGIDGTRRAETLALEELDRLAAEATWKN